MNFGPPRFPIKSVLEIVKEFSIALNSTMLWATESNDSPIKESNFLSIDSSLALHTLGWKTILSVNEALNFTSEWYRLYGMNKDVRSVTEEQINKFAELSGERALLL
jgi:nucleoside-diphosphate-sugar epimerase